MARRKKPLTIPVDDILQLRFSKGEWEFALMDMGGGVYQLTPTRRPAPKRAAHADEEAQTPEKEADDGKDVDSESHQAPG